MTDKYAQIREAMAAGPTPGPWLVASGVQIRSNRDQIAKIWMMRNGEGKRNAAYIAACHPQIIAELLADHDEAEERLETQAAQIDTLTHQVITCGVAARHPDANLTRTGAYAGKWDSQQAEDVRRLRADRDRLRGALTDLLSVYDGTDQQAVPGQFARAARAALSEQEQET